MHSGHCFRIKTRKMSIRKAEAISDETIQKSELGHLDLGGAWRKNSQEQLMQAEISILTPVPDGPIDCLTSAPA